MPMRLVLATSSSIALQPRSSSPFQFDVIFYWAQHEYVRERERESESEKELNLGLLILHCWLRHG